MPAELRLFKDAYVDSVGQLSGTRAMYAVDGIRWAAAAMATPTNLDTLRSEGFQPPAAGANDLFVAASADDGDTVNAALDAAEQAIFAARQSADVADTPSRSLREAVQQQPGSNVAVISVPGEYANLEAHKALSAALPRLTPGRTLIRGLYSGGTLCYESLTILGALVGDVYSNTPLDKRLAVPAPPDAHVCLDLGDEEYTKGRPHPMIDPEARIELLREQGRDPAVAAILLDVVLGHGSHPDPAGQLAPVCEAIHRAGGPQVVAYVLGTHGDPQGFDGQRATLRDAGCVVTETAARTCFAAAAIATRQPTVVRPTW